MALDDQICVDRMHVGFALQRDTCLISAETAVPRKQSYDYKVKPMAAEWDWAYLWTDMTSPGLVRELIKPFEG